MFKAILIYLGSSSSLHLGMGYLLEGSGPYPHKWGIELRYLSNLIFFLLGKGNGLELNPTIPIVQTSHSVFNVCSGRIRILVQRGQN